MFTSVVTLKNKKKIIFVALLLIFTAFKLAGAISLIVDQSHINHINSWHNLSFYNFAQEFKPSFKGIDIVELEIFTNEGAKLIVNIREGSLHGPIVGISKELFIAGDSSNIAQFEFESPITLNSENIYVIELLLEAGAAYIASSFEGGGYSDGDMYINDITTPTDYSDVIFQTGLTRPDLINIKPGSNSSCINVNAAGSFPVAITSSYLYDQTIFRATEVNPETISLAGAGVKKIGKNGKYHCKETYVNNDELLDLVCYIDTKQLVIEEGYFTVSLEAETFDGMSIYGEDTICIVH